MTQAITHQRDTAEPAPPGADHHVCEECGSALEVQQRYCVTCGTRNRNAPSPSAEYFAHSGRRRPPAPAERPRRRSGLGAHAPALLLAILPVAVAVGVLVGKGGSGTGDQKLIDALRSAQPAGQTAGAGAAAVAGAGSSAAAAKKSSVKGGNGGGKVLANTRYGAAHQVSGSKPSAQKMRTDTTLVKKLQRQTGKTYLQQQQGLPDTIVVGK